MVRAINYRELKRRAELDGAEQTSQHLREALRQGDLQANDFSIRELAEALIPDGGKWVRGLDPRQDAGVRIMEADGVDATAFSNVTAQVVYSKIMESYEQEAFAASKLVETIPTRMDGEKIPGATPIADPDFVVAPGTPYPNVGFSEEYVETPQTEKRGLIVPITREAIFFDRTHLILRRAAEVGETLGLNKEKRILDVIVGAANPYVQNGTAYDTYQTSGPWVNELAGNELVDWTDVDAAEQMLAEIVDPTTGEPVLVKANTVLVTPAYRHAAHRVFNAPDITYQGTGRETTTTAANPLGNYGVHESRLLYRRILAAGEAAADAKKWWFLGDFKKAFAYMENWPITVTQAPLGSEAEFASDIVLRFKASERGAAAVLNPRFVVKSTG